MLDKYGDYLDENSVRALYVADDGTSISKPLFSSTERLYFRLGDLDRMIEVTENLLEAEKPIVRRPHHAMTSCSLEAGLVYFLLSNQINNEIYPIIDQIRAGISDHFVGVGDMDEKYRRQVFRESLCKELMGSGELCSEDRQELMSYVYWYILSQLSLRAEQLEHEEELNNYCYTGGTDQGRKNWVNCNVGAEYYALIVPDDHPVILLHGPDDICNFAFNMGEHCAREDRLTQLGDLREMLRLFDLIHFSQIIKENPRIPLMFPDYCSMISSFGKYLDKMELVVEEGATEIDIQTGKNWYIRTNASVLRDPLFYRQLGSISTYKPSRLSLNPEVSKIFDQVFVPVNRDLLVDAEFRMEMEADYDEEE